jgi:predicted lipid-binding transport protein (Tim44 family)
MSRFSDAFAAVMGKVFDFVGWLLSAMFRATEARSETDVATWMSSDVGAVDLMDVPPASAPPARPLWEQAQAQIAALQKIDPDFSEVAFIAQASKEYMAAFAAEGAMNVDSAAAILTPNFRDQLEGRITGWRAAGYRRVAKDLKLDGGTVFKVSIDGDKQRLMVRFVGTAVRYTEDMATGSAADGSTQPESFTEFVSFDRPAGSTTPKPVAAGGPAHCPACGAPATQGTIYCSFCGTPITGTGGIWLLSRISVSAYT